MIQTPSKASSLQNKRGYPPIFAAQSYEKKM